MLIFGSGGASGPTASLARGMGGIWCRRRERRSSFGLAMPPGVYGACFRRWRSTPD